MTRITGTSHKDIYTFMLVSGIIFLIMRNVLDIICRENWRSTLCSNTFSWKSCHLWDNVENLWSQTGHRWNMIGPMHPCALRAGWLRLWSHTH